MIQRMLPLVMALGITAPSLELFAFVAAPQVVAQSSVVLKLRRLGGRVDVVVDGDVVADISILEDRDRFLAVMQSGVIKAGQLVPPYRTEVTVHG